MVIGSGWKESQVAKNGQKQPKMAQNGHKWLDVVRSVWKCLEMLSNGQKQSVVVRKWPGYGRSYGLNIRYGTAVTSEIVYGHTV